MTTNLIRYLISINFTFTQRTLTRDSKPIENLS